MAGMAASTGIEAGYRPLASADGDATLRVEAPLAVTVRPSDMVRPV